MTTLPATRFDRETQTLLEVVHAARQGDRIADEALRNAALECLSARRPMPDLLAAYVMEIIQFGEAIA